MRSMLALRKALTLGLSRRRRPHRVAGNPDDPRFGAEQIQRLGGFLGQADDALRIRHRTDVVEAAA
jgi:hypothetical protein